MELFVGPSLRCCTTGLLKRHSTARVKWNTFFICRWHEQVAFEEKPIDVSKLRAIDIE